MLHVHNNQEITEMNYNIEGDYVIVSIDKLSEFMFITDNTGSIMWVIILLFIILITEVVLAVLKLRKKTGKKVVKTCSFVPFMLAIFIPVGQTAAAIALGVLCVAGGVYNAYLYFLKDRLSKKQVDDKHESEIVLDESVAQKTRNCGE